MDMVKEPTIAWSTVGNGHVLWIEYKYPEHTIVQGDKYKTIPPSTERYVHINNSKEFLTQLIKERYGPKAPI